MFNCELEYSGIVSVARPGSLSKSRDRWYVGMIFFKDMLDHMPPIWSTPGIT